MVLSPQQLVSCSKNPNHCGGTGGCEGSVPEIAFDYVKANGMATEWTYPYESGTSGDTGSCKLNATATLPAHADGPGSKRGPHPVVTVTGFQKLEPFSFFLVPLTRS